MRQREEGLCEFQDSSQFITQSLWELTGSWILSFWVLQKHCRRAPYKSSLIMRSRSPLFIYCPILYGGCWGTYFMIFVILYVASDFSSLIFKNYILITVSSPSTPLSFSTHLPPPPRYTFPLLPFWKEQGLGILMEAFLSCINIILYTRKSIYDWS